MRARRPASSGAQRLERDRVARLRAVPLAAALVDAAELVLDPRERRRPHAAAAVS